MWKCSFDSIKMMQIDDCFFIEVSYYRSLISLLILNVIEAF